MTSFCHQYKGILCGKTLPVLMINKHRMPGVSVVDPEWGWGGGGGGVETKSIFFKRNFWKFGNLEILRGKKSG